MQNLPLSGIRVLDLSQYVSGPYCAKLLGEFGAEVVKVESPDGGDMARRCGPFPEGIPHPEMSGLFFYLNTGKKGITLDARSRTGQEILEQLVRTSDIIVENAGPGSWDCEGFRRTNPAVITTSISYYGQTHAELPGSDITLQARGGIMHTTGLPGREPLKIAGPQAEYQAGLNAAVATMVALHHRDETGQGQHVDISVLEVLASILEGALLGYAYDGTVRNREGARHPSMYPSTILPCKDGYLHVDASADWDTFARFTGIDQLSQFQPDETRKKADEIDQLLTAWLADKPRDDTFHRAQEWRLPFAIVMGIDELEDDPQIRSRRFFERISHPFAGEVLCPGAPFTMSRSEHAINRAPTLGEHNEEIYVQEMGYTKEDLVRLRGMGVI